MEVIIVNESKLKEKVSEFKKGGSSKLHVLSDFDRTLTKAFIDGKKIPSLISVLRDGNYLIEGYAEKAHALYDKYHPMEVDVSIPLEEKSKAMLKWWTTHFNLLIESNLTKEDLEMAVKSGKSQFREGVHKFINLLHKNDIPLIIISSAGVGLESISMYFENEGTFFDNVHIISNSFKWENNKAIGVNKPIIHVFNKSEASIQGLSIHDELLGKKNVLLLGDSLGDPSMIEGFNYDNLIKIGFLNYEDEENIEDYKKAYDVVIIGDGDFSYINELLKEILNLKP